MVRVAPHAVALLIGAYLLGSCSDHGSDPPPPDQTDKQYPIPWPSLASSPWPMGNHDPQATGRSPYPTAGVGIVNKFVEGLRVTGSPVLAEDGTIYYQCQDSTWQCALYALRSDGTLKWKVGLDSLRRASVLQKLYSRMIVAADGTIYTNSLDEALYAVNPDGTVKWMLSAPGRFLENGLTIGMDGTLYAMSESNSYLYAITPQGTVKWSVAGGFSGYSHMVFSPDGSTLYVGGYPEGLFAVTASDGATKWFNSQSSNGQYKFRMVDVDGNIYSPFRDSLVCIRADGTRDWSVSFGKDAVGGTIDWNGIVYFATSISDSAGPRWHLCAVDQGGKLLWTEKLGSYFPEHMVCDSENTIYAGSGSDGEFFAVRANGDVKWKLVFSPFIEISTSPAITSNGILILPSGSTTPTEAFGLFFIQ